MSDGTALEKLMDNLREEFTTNPPLYGAYQPKKNDLCAAKFADDQRYRGKVEKMEYLKFRYSTLIMVTMQAYQRPNLELTCSMVRYMVMLISSCRLTWLNL